MGVFGWRLRLRLYLVRVASEAADLHADDHPIFAYSAQGHWLWDRTVLFGNVSQCNCYSNLILFVRETLIRCLLADVAELFVIFPDA